MTSLYQWLLDNGHEGKLPKSFPYPDGHTQPTCQCDMCKLADRHSGRDSLWLAALKQIPIHNNVELSKSLENLLKCCTIAFDQEGICDGQAKSTEFLNACRQAKEALKQIPFKACLDENKLKKLLDYICYKHNTSPKNFRMYAEEALKQIEAPGKNHPDNLTASEYQRLVEWMKDPKRKSAITAFTASACRDAARAFEQYLEAPNLVELDEKAVLKILQDNILEYLKYVPGYRSCLKRATKAICKKFGQKIEAPKGVSVDEIRKIAIKTDAGQCVIQYCSNQKDLKYGTSHEILHRLAEAIHAEITGEKK